MIASSAGISAISRWQDLEYLDYIQYVTKKKRLHTIHVTILNYKVHISLILKYIDITTT